MSGSLLPALRSLLAAALVVWAAAAPASARLGDPVSKLKDHFGRAPERESPKGMAIWFIESIDGALVYTATLDAKGIIIAEGIKPLKRAILTTEIAKDFLQDQMAPFLESKTARVVRPGEKYEFAKQSFDCGANDFVFVDEPHGILLIWTRSGIPSVIALSPEVLLKPKP
jgi:hypothetical protein